MHQTRKGQQLYFGMKLHIGVDSQSGLAHCAVVTLSTERIDGIQCTRRCEMRTWIEWDIKVASQCLDAALTKYAILVR